MKHVPVLLKEAMAHLNVQRGEKYIDATVGMGGHTEQILSSGGIVLGVDRDLSALQYLERKFQIPNSKFQTAHGRFSELEEIAREKGFEPVAGILFDLGIGSHQLDDPERGFSFQKQGPLDMRFNTFFPSPLRGEGGRRPGEGVTAADIVNTYSEQKLRELFEKYGEEKRFSRKIARGIIEQRKIKPLQTTTELFELIKRALPGKMRFRAGDTARKIFQALRIEVNDELEELKNGLPQAQRLLKPKGPGLAETASRGGRLVVISFHSLEDRIVKNFMNYEAKDCVCPPEFPVCQCDKQATLKILTRKPITASSEEIKLNPRAASAKLRAAERI